MYLAYKTLNSFLLPSLFSFLLPSFYKFILSTHSFVEMEQSIIRKIQIPTMSWAARLLMATWTWSQDISSNFILFLIGGYLIYNIVMVSATYQHESVPQVYICPFPLKPPPLSTSLPIPPLKVAPEHRLLTQDILTSSGWFENKSFAYFSSNNIFHFPYSLTSCANPSGSGPSMDLEFKLWKVKPHTVVQLLDLSFAHPCISNPA